MNKKLGIADFFCGMMGLKQRSRTGRGGIIVAIIRGVDKQIPLKNPLLLVLFTKILGLLSLFRMQK